jgi:outer membrane protein OmpA-like peptidoglycan-associated protein
MKSARILVATFAVAVFCSSWPISASADEWNKATRLTFNQPVEVPGLVLPAGTYVFKRVDSHVVEILNAEQTHVYATLETIPGYRTDPSDKTVIIFEERQQGSPEAIKSWFYPGEIAGEEFVYASSVRSKNKFAAIESEITNIRNAEAEQAERIDSVDRDAQRGLTEANQAATAAAIANTMASAADITAADADRAARKAQQTARDAMNRTGTLAEQIEGQIATLDKFTTAHYAAVTFKSDSDALSDEAKSALDDIVDEISQSQQGYVIELQGFTDNVGTEKYNVTLSDRRVESVLRYLVSNNIPLYRISLVGLGTADPVADNSTASGREQNRRVEIRILRSVDTAGAAAQQ